MDSAKIKEMRLASFLLPDPGGEVVRECLDEIVVLKTNLEASRDAGPLTVPRARVAGGGETSKFRKKPVEIEAHQWFKNGDHPADESVQLQGMPDGELFEGKVVRYYRTPDLDGARVCEHCRFTMHAHGWIDTLEGGHTVCPGDWIITDVKNERYPCKPDIFEMTYEPVEELPKKPEPIDRGARR